MKVRDDELVLLHRFGTDHRSSPDLDVSRRAVDIEVARRNIVATVQSSRATQPGRSKFAALRLSAGLWHRMRMQTLAPCPLSTRSESIIDAASARWMANWTKAPLRDLYRGRAQSITTAG